VVYEAATAAGFTTSTEVPLPGRADLIPADILISGPPLARPTAVDFSILEKLSINAFNAS
jgi:hypothetical protein